MENREFFINDDGIRIHTKLDFPKEKKQKYPLVIIIHGFTGHMEERHITAVAKAMNEVGYVSLRAEMYGHGKSDGEFCNHTLYKWISNALAVIDYAMAYSDSCWPDVHTELIDHAVNMTHHFSFQNKTYIYCIPKQKFFYLII